MYELNSRGYVTAALLMNKTIKEMRDHVEYEKFICRMLIDNDDTRLMKDNTQNHPDSKYRFLYNNEKIDKLTEHGKYEAIGLSNYQGSGILPSTNTNLEE